ncbi:MAG: SnoaL-like domain-containing protein [Opitutae bacterium]|nr:SnoaL-like domain-containing protein [Opitutae bacterium]
MKKRIGIFLLIYFAVALLLFWLFYPSDEEQILARFEELSDIASKSGAASTIADALVLEDFRDLFAPQVSLRTGGTARHSDEYTDRELVQLYGRIRLQSKRLSLRFENIEILSVVETDATTTADVHAEGTDNIRDPHRVESFHAQIDLRKIDGDWKFRQFIYIESLPGK